MTFLATISRLLERPVSVAVRGESSSGKSFATKRALELTSPEANHTLTASSPKALVYSKEDLSHRMLVIHEGKGIDSDFANYAIRSLLSEGRLDYEVTDIENRTTVRIVKEGPTGLITSTAGKIDYELSTRLLSVSIDDSPEVTAAILRIEALEAAGLAPGGEFADFQAFDRWIAAGTSGAVVPFAMKIAAATDSRAVRMRRDFSAILGLVQACALAHQANRELDHQGRVVAELDDYRMVHGLVADIVAHSSGQSVPKEVRETVDAVAGACGRLKQGWVYLSDIAVELDLHRTSVSRRVNRAMGLGLLCESPDGARHRRTVCIGEPMSDDVAVLPDPASIA